MHTHTCTCVHSRICYSNNKESNSTCLFWTRTLGPKKTILIIELSLFHRFIYIAMGPQLTVLIIEVSTITGLTVY